MYKLSNINPAKYNPRKWNDQEKSGLKESIKKFGCIDPLIVNIRDGKNVLVGGHFRLVVMEELKFEKVPVVEVDLSPAEEKALNVALNSPTISGKFDKEILSELLVEIKLEMPKLHNAFNFDDLIIDTGDNPIIESDIENIEEDASSHSVNVKHTCPSCGYEW